MINDVLTRNQAEIRWSYFIYDQWIWYSDTRGRQKGGFKGDHTNHIYVSWSQASSQGSGFIAAEVAMDALTRKIQAVSWRKGWWKVWDGSVYHYYFGPGGVVKYTKAKPSNTISPPQRADNTGTYTYSGNRLVIIWKQAAGAESPCTETFYNARPDCQQMNATSNLYSPLVATPNLG